MWNVYYGDGSSDLTHDQKLTKIYSDYHFNVPVNMAIKEHIKCNDTYLFRYSHQSQITTAGLLSAGKLTDLGVGHFDECFHMFTNKVWYGYTIMNKS